MPLSDDLSNDLIARTISIQRFKEQERLDIFRLLRKLETTLIEQLIGVDPTEPRATIFQQQRQAALLKNATKAIQIAYSEAHRRSKENYRRLAQIEAENSLRIINDRVGIDIANIGLDSQELRVLSTHHLTENAPSREHWQRQSRRLATRFRDEIRLGMLQGETLSDLVRRVRGRRENGFRDGLIRGTTRSARREAEALVRTSVQSVSNQARLNVYRNNSRVIRAVQWVSTLDARTTDICMALSGLVWNITEGGEYRPDGHDIEFPGPTAHWNCFTGDVRVSSPSGFRRLYRRPYSGELVTLKRSNDSALVTATPNHPVLTPSGWKPIGQLDVGDKLICKKNSVDQRATSPEYESWEPSFEELVKTTAELLRVLPMKMPVSLPDFHGDGTDDEVGEVWSYSLLRRERNISFAQFMRHLYLQRRYFDGPESLSSLRGFFKRFAGWLATARGAIGSTRIGFLSSSPTGMKLFGSRAGFSRCDAPSTKRAQSDAELFRDLTGSKSVLDVEIDRVSMIRRREAVSIPVHNLETPENWFFAGGIVSHNCRSTQVPITRSWRELSRSGAVRTKEGGNAAIDNIFRREIDRGALTPAHLRGTRASMNGQVARDLSFSDWLRDQPVPVQNKLLGPGRLRLWREQRISLRDLIDQKGRPLTLDELEKLR